MLRNKILLIIASLALVTSIALAEDKDSSASAPAKADASPAEKSAKTEAKPEVAAAKKPVSQKQSEVASKTAKFGSISKTDEAYKTAFDAHELENGHQNIDKPGAFKGTVSGIYEPKGNARLILNFDPNYKSAMTALVTSPHFSKFPELKKLTGKEVVVSGKFVDYQGNTEIILTGPDQIKIVETSETKAEKKE